MRALVTGCAGFIGSHLTDRLLAEGYQVSGIDCFTDYYPEEIKRANMSNSIKSPNFEFIEGDILEMDSFPEVDYLFHEAAQAGVRASWGDNFEIYTRNNIEVTQKLLEFCKDRGIKKFVYASSSSIYGDAELPMKETYLPKPISPYGVSKLAGEHLCYLYWKGYGVPSVSLRYFTVYGPRQRPDMAIHKFIKAISSGEKVTIFGDGTQTRSFTFVDDVVDANILAAQKGIPGDSLNIGSSEQISVNDLLRKIEQLLGKTARIEYIHKQKGDVRDTAADSGKVLDVLNWKAMTALDTGLRNTLLSMI